MENHLCCVIELFAWEALVLNQFKPGKTKLHGIWRHAISNNWIDLMENRWNSSGKISKDSLHGDFSMRLKIWWRN